MAKRKTATALSGTVTYDGTDAPTTQLDSPAPQKPTQVTKVATQDLGNGVTLETPTGLYPVGTWGYYRGVLFEVKQSHPHGAVLEGEKTWQDAGEAAMAGWERFRPLSQGALLAASHLNECWQDIQTAIKKSPYDEWRLDKKAWRDYLVDAWLQLVDARVAMLELESQKAEKGQARAKKAFQERLGGRVSQLTKEMRTFSLSVANALNVKTEINGVRILKPEFTSRY